MLEENLRLETIGIDVAARYKPTVEGERKISRTRKCCTLRETTEADESLEI